MSKQTLRIEDHTSFVVLVRHRDNKIMKRVSYHPGSISSATSALQYAAGYRDGYEEAVSKKDT